MKIVIKDRFDLEFGPEEVPDELIERLIECASSGLSVGADIIEEVLRLHMGRKVA